MRQVAGQPLVLHRIVDPHAEVVMTDRSGVGGTHIAVEGVVAAGRLYQLDLHRADEHVCLVHHHVGHPRETRDIVFDPEALMPWMAPSWRIPASRSVET